MEHLKRGKGETEGPLHNQKEEKKEERLELRK
jgi:hypothetical protein